jgi:hypothetical protein
MGVLENYCKNKFNSIIISKICIQSLKNYPKLQCFFLYFLLNIKQYKKNLLLFYLVINLIFGGVSFVRKKTTGSLTVFKVTVNKKKMFIFLQSFIYFYLPLLNASENVYKTTVSKRQESLYNICFYRFNFFSFPAISELDLIYESFELIYDFISNFKLQLDIVVKVPKNTFFIGDILLRMYRFPCNTKSHNFL